jgi:hypothetical protein
MVRPRRAQADPAWTGAAARDEGQTDLLAVALLIVEAAAPVRESKVFLNGSDAVRRIFRGSIAAGETDEEQCGQRKSPNDACSKSEVTRHDLPPVSGLSLRRETQD